MGAALEKIRAALELSDLVDSDRATSGEQCRKDAAIAEALAALAELEREPTPDECISIAFWHSQECEFCCINQSESEDYGRAMLDAVRAVMGGES